MPLQPTLLDSDTKNVSECTTKYGNIDKTPQRSNLEPHYVRFFNNMRISGVRQSPKAIHSNATAQAMFEIK